MTDDPMEDAIEKAWGAFVNAQDDRYFGNRTKMDKQKAALRQLVKDTAALAPQEAIVAELEAKVARLREAVKKAKMALSNSVPVFPDVERELAAALNDQVQS